MDNNAIIRGAGGVDGDVYSNGSVIGSLGAQILGDIIVSTGLTEDMVERSTLCDADEVVGKSDPRIDFAQSFTASESKKLSKISIYIKKNNNPTDKTIHITGDASGKPASVSLSDGVVQSSLVGSGYAWIDVVFPSPATLVAGQTYWIVFDATEHNSKYWLWCKDSLAGYAGGSAVYSNNWDTDPWSSVPGDLTFELFFGDGFSQIDSVNVTGTAKANTIKNSAVGKDAYYQTIISSTVSGTSFPGSTDPPVLSMPISDAIISGWKADALAGGTITGNCPGAAGCSLAMGPKRINGNLSIDIGDTLTLTGIVHVTGNFIPGNNSFVVCDASFGAKGCLLVVDGFVDVSNNVTFSGSGNPQSFVLVLSDVADCKGGVQQAWCAPQNSAVYIANNATGAIFYATDSQIYLNNGVEVTSVIGYKLHLANGAIITYNTNLSDIDFSSSPDSGWKINDWKEIQ
jgi:hypothetical protein